MEPTKVPTQVPEVTSLEVSQPKKFSPLLIVLLILVALTAGAIGYRGYRQWRKTQLARATKTVVKDVLVRRSKIPNVITQATTAKVIDVKTGKVITAARVFTLNDKTVYLSLDLDSPTIGTRIDYIRYLSGRYVDHAGIKIEKPNTSLLNFSWAITRPLGSLAEGSYKVATYSNGILEKRITYVIEKNKVASVTIDDSVSSSDPDYRLALVAKQ